MQPENQKWLIIAIVNIVILIFYSFSAFVEEISGTGQGYSIAIAMLMFIIHFCTNLFFLFVYFVTDRERLNDKGATYYVIGLGIIGLIGLSFCSKV